MADLPTPPEPNTTTFTGSALLLIWCNLVLELELADQRDFAQFNRTADSANQFQNKIKIGLALVLDFVNSMWIDLKIVHRNVTTIGTLVNSVYLSCRQEASYSLSQHCLLETPITSWVNWRQDNWDDTCSYHYLFVFESGWEICSFKHNMDLSELEISEFWFEY
jgi:hypothetical protein